MLYKYSDFSPEQIINKKYEQLCDKILNMTEDENIKQKMKRNTI